MGLKWQMSLASIISKPEELCLQTKQNLSNISLNDSSLTIENQSDHNISLLVILE